MKIFLRSWFGGLIFHLKKLIFFLFEFFQIHQLPCKIAARCKFKNRPSMQTLIFGGCCRVQASTKPSSHAPTTPKHNHAPLASFSCRFLFVILARKLKKGSSEVEIGTNTTPCQSYARVLLGAVRLEARRDTGAFELAHKSNIQICP